MNAFLVAFLEPFFPFSEPQFPNLENEGNNACRPDLWEQRKKTDSNVLYNLQSAALILVRYNWPERETKQKSINN